MALSPTDIINLGMFAIGAKKLFAPSDNTKAARLATSIYEYMKLLVFQLPIDWHWCTTRSESLAQLADPVSGYDHQYALPDSVARILKMIDKEGKDIVEFTYQEGVLVEAGDTTVITKTLQTDVDDGDVYIKYIVLIDDTAMYPSWFAQLISLNIAIYLAEPLKQHTPHYTKVKDMLEIALVAAEEANALYNVTINNNTLQDRDHGNDDLVNAGSLGITDRTEIIRGVTSP